MRGTAAATVAALLASAACALAACTTSGSDRFGGGTSGSGPPATHGSAVETTIVGANATVVRVIDGDTVDVDVDGTVERVRLIGIDTPETKKPNHPIECWGPEASAHTAALLPPGTSVLVERDVVGRDDYGRLLGYVHRTDDGLFVNRELVQQGFARPLTIAPNDLYAAQFTADARAAEAADLGMWAACG
jgi:endonuclease YncB( thermonuclease family)